MNETSLIIQNLNSIVQLLVDFNATINATKVYNFNGALILLQSGANEKTPLSSALNEHCARQVVELLIKYDAFVSNEEDEKYNKMKSILEPNSEIFPTKIDFSEHFKKKRSNYLKR